MTSIVVFYGLMLGQEVYWWIVQSIRWRGLLGFVGGLGSGFGKQFGSLMVINLEKLVKVLANWNRELGKIQGVVYVEKIVHSLVLNHH